MGLWNFDDKVSPKELSDGAAVWAAEDMGYLTIYIRRTANSRLSIGFTYEVPATEDPKVVQNEYIKRTSEFLKTRFGSHLLGWDIASTAYLVK